MKKDPRSLRAITEAEGKGEVLGGRELIAGLVHYTYREARQALREGLDDMGNFGMLMFMNQMEKLGKLLHEEGDLLGSMLCRHNMASAVGFRDKTEQNAINREVLAELEQLVNAKQVEASDPDVVFLRWKVTFGLIENDLEFADDYSQEDHYSLVIAMYNQRYPDFPGRALAFVRELPIGDATDEQLGMLRRAAVCDFGKEDQKADVVAYLEAIDDSE